MDSIKLRIKNQSWGNSQEKGDSLHGRDHRKMKEYLAMDTEIDFKEFDEYYRKLIEKLNSDYQEMSQEDLLNMRYVLNTVAVNAENRSLRKDKFAKKYRKIQEKNEFLV